MFLDTYYNQFGFLEESQCKIVRLCINGGD